MSAFEDLTAQKREVDEMKIAIEKYRFELIMIQSSINAIIYRANSICVSDYELQAMDALKDQRKSKVAELKMDYQLTPHLIPEQIKEYNHQISMIRMQLDTMEQQATKQTQPEPDSVRAST